MKYFTYRDIENEQVYEIYQKTRKNEKPKECFACENPINKNDFYSESDCGEAYCIDCCAT